MIFNHMWQAKKGAVELPWSTAGLHFFMWIKTAKPWQFHDQLLNLHTLAVLWSSLLKVAKVMEGGLFCRIIPGNSRDQVRYFDGNCLVIYMWMNDILQEHAN